MNIEEASRLILEPLEIFERDGELADLLHKRELTRGKLSFEAALQIEEETRIEVSEACLDFSYDRRWRALPPEQQLLIYARLKAASRLLALIDHETQKGRQAAIQIGPEADHRSLFSFLLIDYWGLCGRRLWIAELARLHTL